MYKEDQALNNLQWLICHKIKPTQPSTFTATPGHSGPGSNGNEQGSADSPDIQNQPSLKDVF